MFEKIKGIIVEQLGVAEEDVKETARLKEDLGADSLDLFELVMAIEEEYDVEIPAEDAANIKTIKDVMDYVNAKGNEA